MSSNRKKKQHYVPQCYLKAWAIDGTHQIHVYDKKLKKDRVNNILDVASENYFYDIDFKKALSSKEKDIIGLDDNELEKMGSEQFLENFFANNVEGEFSKLLAKLIGKAENFKSYKRKWHFISKWTKLKFSRHLAFQNVRTKNTRVSINDISDCLEQMLIEMNAPKDTIDSMGVTKDSVKLIHGQMILNKEEITRVALHLNKMFWVLVLNNTEKDFFTSDKPISTKPHIIDNLVPKTGIMSEGVEVFYPISPKVMLVMFEPLYHHNLSKFDRHYFLINDPKVVDTYNVLTTIFATRCVFSKTNDFSIIEQMLLIDNTIFDRPSISLSWNGKVFYPR